ncbi:hypothetical protein ACFVHB_37660 [Kitasatospora sp. NPDC127111]|uniref:hypothetical protein n=1 Tax=Kitasatospora sp. NPDC127111 TaxID=3345363 RepID=UPI00362F6BF6
MIARQGADLPHQVALPVMAAAFPFGPPRVRAGLAGVPSLVLVVGFRARSRWFRW